MEVGHLRSMDFPLVYTAIDSHHAMREGLIHEDLAPQKSAIEEILKKY